MSGVETLGGGSNMPDDVAVTFALGRNGRCRMRRVRRTTDCTSVRCTGPDSVYMDMSTASITRSSRVRNEERMARACLGRARRRSQIALKRRARARGATAVVLRRDNEHAYHTCGLYERTMTTRNRCSLIYIAILCTLQSCCPTQTSWW